MRPLVVLLAVLALTVASAAGAATPRAMAEAQARDAVSNLIENSRETCPILSWHIVKVEQGSFRGIAHPGRGALLWKVTADVRWAGLMFHHLDAWTVVAGKALPADTNRSTTAVYRDREAAWIGNGCFGTQPFGQS